MKMIKISDEQNEEFVIAYKNYRKLLKFYENYLMWKFNDYNVIIREHDKDIFEVVFINRNHVEGGDKTFFVTLNDLNHLDVVSRTDFLPILLNDK